MTRGGAGAGSVLLGATAIAGALGYLTQTLAGALLPAEQYERFGVAWSLLYLVVGALAGLQQEMARVAEPGARRVGSVSGVTWAVALLAAVGVVIVGALGGLDFPLLASMAVGVAGYALLAVVSGLLYGASAWIPIAATMVLDALLRLVLVGIVLAIDGPLWLAVLGVGAPFAATVLLASPWIRRRVEDIAVAIPTRALLSNVAHTITGSLATAVLISGFPYVLRLIHPADAASFGAFIFAFTLSRAPLVVVALSLQSFLVTRFKVGRPPLSRMLVPITAITLAAAGLAWLLGPVILDRFFGPDYAVAGPTLAAVVASTLPLSILCVTSPLALARGHHRAFTTGWIVAAATAIALAAMTSSLPLAWSALAAISIGPVLGAIVQLALLRRQPHG